MLGERDVALDGARATPSRGAVLDRLIAALDAGSVSGLEQLGALSSPARRTMPG